MKIVDLKADMRNVDVRFRVIEKGEIREIQSRDGKTLNLSEAEVGDSTGRIYLTLWDQSIELLENEDLGEVRNGFIKVVRNELRLNIGKYGELSKIEEDDDIPPSSKIPNSFPKPPEDYRPPYKKKQRRRY
ncbi:MAG: single-stranded DNA-binding protein [Asgard group archaeon]|nr:single-stranded DNA-binding protein [Asgard group archaeon]